MTATRPSSRASPAWQRRRSCRSFRAARRTRRSNRARIMLSHEEPVRLSLALHHVLCYLRQRVRFTRGAGTLFNDLLPPRSVGKASPAARRRVSMIDGFYGTMNLYGWHVLDATSSSTLPSLTPAASWNKYFTVLASRQQDEIQLLSLLAISDFCSRADREQCSRAGSLLASNCS